MQPVASSNCDCMHATHALGVPRTRFCEHFAALSFPNLQSLAVERYPCPIANLLRSVPAAQITSLSVSGTSHSLESLDVQSFPNLVDCSITVCVDQARAAPVSIFEDPEQSEQVVNASRILSAALRGPSLLRTLHLAVSRATESVPLNVEHVGSKCLQTLTLAFAVTFASLAPIMQSSPRLRRLSVDSVTGSFAPAHCSASIEELEVCATGEMGVREFAALGSLTACLPSLVRLVVDDEPACRRLAHVSRSGIDVISGSSR
ncbi:hypothetical protein FBU59_006412 [Linderina macrospora]|uniref:Uncharacterized protein n=1 Tax=Linderina macrospora TaxID=4868 RepID=A0ACC1J001_9FUNG|nr:hypothetical protein FBU59_006412 [Linderina macrospora]